MKRRRWVVNPDPESLFIPNSDAMDQLQLQRYCCRRMVMTHVDLIEKFLRWVLGSISSSFPIHIMFLSQVREGKENSKIKGCTLDFTRFCHFMDWTAPSDRVASSLLLFNLFSFLFFVSIFHPFHFAFSCPVFSCQTPASRGHADAVVGLKATIPPSDNWCVSGSREREDEGGKAGNGENLKKTLVKLKQTRMRKKVSDSNRKKKKNKSFYFDRPA